MLPIYVLEDERENMKPNPKLCPAVGPALDKAQDHLWRSRHGPGVWGDFRASEVLKQIEDVLSFPLRSWWDLEHARDCFSSHACPTVPASNRTLPAALEGSWDSAQALMEVPMMDVREDRVARSSLRKFANVCLNLIDVIYMSALRNQRQCVRQ